MSSSKSYKSYEELLQNSARYTRSNYRSDFAFKQAADEALKTNSIAQHVKSKANSAKVDKMINAMMNVLLHGDASDKTDLYTLLAKHGYGIAPAGDRAGSVLYKLPPNTPPADVDQLIYSQFGTAPTAPPSKPQPAGQPPLSKPKHVDPNDGDGAAVDDPRLAEASKTIEQLKSDLLELSKENKGIREAIEQMREDHDAQIQQLLKSEKLAIAQREQIREEALKMQQAFMKLENDYDMLREQKREPSESGSLATADSGGMDIEDEPAQQQQPQQSIWTRLFGINVIDDPDAPTPAPAAAGTNIPVNQNTQQTQEQQQQQANTPAPVQAVQAVVAPVQQPSVDEKERKLKDEQGTKKQAQLGYNPSVNWYGETTQWGKIINELDSFSWHYKEPFKTTIEPWSMQQLEAIDPFL